MGNRFVKDQAAVDLSTGVTAEIGAEPLLNGL
jgi:hypothetical protein